MVTDVGVLQVTDVPTYGLAYTLPSFVFTFLSLSFSILKQRGVMEGKKGYEIPKFVFCNF